MPSLTLAELAWLKDQTHALPGKWSLEIISDPAELSAALLPNQGDSFAATYLMDRAAEGYRISACRWDELCPVGVFATLADGLAHVARVAASASFLRLQ
jgi:hypothetical protein